MCRVNVATCCDVVNVSVYKVAQSKVDSTGKMDEQEYLYKKNKFMTEFILQYKSMPCLWRTKSREYHMRDLRSKSYKSLILKLREIDPTADRVSVVKKINSLRSNLRKEKNKVADQAKQGVVYKPKLWYYPLFDFLEGQERGRVGSNDSEVLSEEEGTEIIHIKYEQNVNEYDREVNDPLLALGHPHQDESSGNVASPSPPSQKRISLSTESESVTQLRSSKITPEQTISKITKLEEYPINGDSIREDQYDLFGRNVATKLRNIASTDNKQRLMAEKMINDALFLAEMGEITLAHCNRLHTG